MSAYKSALQKDKLMFKTIKWEKHVCYSYRRGMSREFTREKGPLVHKTLEPASIVA